MSEYYRAGEEGASPGHPRRRQEDKGKVGKANHFFERYKIFFMAALPFLAFLGVKWASPGTRINEVEAAILRIERDSLPSLRREQTRVKNEVGILTRLRCFDKDVNSRERALAGLKCDEVYRGTFAVEVDSTEVHP